MISKFTKLLILLSVFHCSLCLLKAQNLQSKNENEAERIWELAIQAKGGRKKLYQVENILDSSQINEILNDGKKNVIHRVNLNVLPDKSWKYEDAGKTVFGINVIMFNYENLTGYFESPDKKEMLAQPLKESFKKKVGFDNPAIFLLLESKWLKPTIIKSYRDRINLTEVDMVETQIGGRRIVFALDKQNHLPKEVTFYNYYNADETTVFKLLLSDYVEVNNIKVPKTRIYENGTIEKSKIQFNVDYNPEIFMKCPANFGADSWKAKTNESK